jgi:cell division protein FtsW
MTTRVRKNRLGEIDYPLLVTVTALVLFGLIAIWATSVSDAMRETNGSAPLGYVVAQIKWLAIGTVAAVVAYAVGYRTLAQISIPLMLATLLLLSAVLVFGEYDYGSYRRIVILGFNVQPSEIAKPIMIIYLARWLSSKGDKLNDNDSGMIPFILLVGIYVALIMFQPNFSTALILAAVALMMFLMAGATLKRVGLMIVGGFGLALAAVLPVSYQRERILGFLFGGNSNAAQQRELVLDLTQSAGIVGNGLDKMHARTQSALGAHKDFIFAFTTYGFGIIAALLIIGAFLYLAYRAVRIARRAPDDLGALTAAGIGCWILLQALIHIGVNVGALPITGMTLPFVSYGGSSLLACMTGMGVLLSISRDAVRRETKKNAAYSYGGRNRRPRVSGAHRGGSAARTRTRR